jgi:hypothetical protein
MRRHAKWIAGLSVLLVFGLFSALRAETWVLKTLNLQPVSDANVALPTAAANVLSSPLSSAGSTAIGSTPLRPKSTRNCPRVVVAPSLSDNTATVCLAVVLYHQTGTTYTGETVAAIQTFTGTTAMTIDSGRFVTTDGYLTVPTLGCQSYDVRVLYISTGNVTWRSWPLGADTAASTTTDE